MLEKWSGEDAEAALAAPLPKTKKELEQLSDNFRQYLLATLTAGSSADPRFVMMLDTIDRKIEHFQTDESLRLTRSIAYRTLWVSIGAVVIAFIANGLTLYQMRLDRVRFDAEIRPELELRTNGALIEVVNKGRRPAYRVTPVVDWVDASGTQQVLSLRELPPLDVSVSAPLRVLTELLSLPSLPLEGSSVFISVRYASRPDDRTHWAFLPLYAGHLVFDFENRILQPVR